MLFIFLVLCCVFRASDVTPTIDDYVGDEAEAETLEHNAARAGHARFCPLPPSPGHARFSPLPPRVESPPLPAHGCS